MPRNQPELPKSDEAKKGDRRSPAERKLDDEVEASFPASDPPSHIAGHPGAPKERGSRKPGLH